MTNGTEKTTRAEAPLTLRFVPPSSADFRMLAAKLDEFYFSIVGDVQLRYVDCNRPEKMTRLAVVYADGQPVACGGWKTVDDRTAEIKRIYVLPDFRRRGAATRLVHALEQDAAAQGKKHIVLETARTTPGSAALYRALGYRETDYYGSPAGAENCLCFEKDIEETNR